MPTNLLDQYGANGEGTTKGLNDNAPGGINGGIVSNEYRPTAVSYQTNTANQVLPKFAGDSTYSENSSVAPNGGINQGHY